MKFFVASLLTETNTYTPVPTGWSGFRDGALFHGDASTRDAQGMGMFAAEVRRLLAAEGHETVESLTAFAQPFGRTVREVYESLRDEILSDLAAAVPVDGVVLVLHGAMVAEGYDDCEGDLLARVRSIVGPDVPIGVELDLHCHYTELMHISADVIVGYKEYPHTDILLRLQELTRIVHDAALGRVRPTMAVFDCKMIGLWHTTREPMAGFVRRMQECEQLPGVLSVSLGHGFPWGDVAESGAKMWVVTDNDPRLAATLAEQLGREFWALRHQTGTPVLSIEAALNQAQSVDGGPVVLADIADNAGGGAMSDSTFLLRAVLEQGVADVAIGAFWDLGAIQICRQAGIGAHVDLRLGGKCGPASGDPIDLPVTVKAIKDDFSQPGLSNIRSPLGLSVWVQAADGLDIVLTSMRSQVFSPEIFTGLGIDLAYKKLIIVKSTQHFHALFAPLAKVVLYVSSPGAMSNNFADLPYRVRSLDYWPRVENPHATSIEMPAPGELHQVDGLRLHLQRSGPAVTDAGQPTIIIEAGGGCASPHYARLQKALARKYAVCSHDRPGMGWSDSDNEPLDAVRHAHRLHALLNVAGVSGPLVFVGHSLGGLLMHVYTSLYPQQVVGLVMLDASHSSQFDDVDDGLFDGLAAAHRAKVAAYCDGGPMPSEFELVNAVFADMPEVAQQILATTLTLKSADAFALESRGLKQVAKQAAAAGDLGARPLTVLWAPVRHASPLDSDTETVRTRWQDYQRKHAELSTRSRLLAVEGADHMSLALLEPFVTHVAEEIERLLAQLV